MYKPNPWHPESNVNNIKILGKLLEELGELTAAASRCLIQGTGSAHPVTGKPNAEWLREEIADVLAGIELTRERFFIPAHLIEERKREKIAILREWHKMGT